MKDAVRVQYQDTPRYDWTDEGQADVYYANGEVALLKQGEKFMVFLARNGWHDDRAQLWRIHPEDQPKAAKAREA